MDSTQALSDPLDKHWALNTLILAASPSSLPISHLQSDQSLTLTRARAPVQPHSDQLNRNRWKRSTICRRDRLRLGTLQPCELWRATGADPNECGLRVESLPCFYDEYDWMMAARPTIGIPGPISSSKNLTFIVSLVS
jgi:hypothetical protein